MDRPAEKVDHTRSRAGKQGHPPPLPAKQRRSLYSQGSNNGSSMDLDPDGDSYSPFGSQSQTPAFSEVFSTPTDCHAPQCPIHHSTGHQDRFLSDSTPPPVPKKLTRALSLPGGCLYPRCSVPSCHRNYVNPLYMLAPIMDRQLNTEQEEEKAATERSFPSQPLTLLRFDTPDFQLPFFFKNFQDQEQVCLDIQQCHLLFLKRIAQQRETLFLSGIESTKGVESFQPEDFKLCEGYQSKQIGGAVFYAVHCPKLPGRMFSAKVYRPNSGSTTSLALSKPLPPHTNIQQVLTHFPQCPQSERNASTEKSQAAISTEASQALDNTSPQSPCSDSTDVDRQHGGSAISKGGTVLSLLSAGCEVNVERELPWGTLADFVQDGTSLHRCQPPVYERQLCLLLLQLAQGLQHLRRHAATCTELQPQNVTLVWSEREMETEGWKRGGGTEEAGERSTSHTAEREIEGAEPRDWEDGWTQKLWKKHGTPWVMITTYQALSESGQNSASEELQFASLIHLCLHLPEKPLQESMDSPKASQASPYSRGLLRLASLLLDQANGLQMADTAGVLQALLWGPRAELFHQNHPGPNLLPNWLSVKRSLLVLKLAERGLSDDRDGLDWEDCLCLQYLSKTGPDFLLKITTLLDLQNYTSKPV